MFSLNKEKTMMSSDNAFLKNSLFQNISYEKKQFFSFLVIGGLNTLFGYGIFSSFIFLKFHYTAAMLFSTIIGVIFNFFTTGRFVFKNKKNSLFIKFLITYTMLYLLNILIVSLLNKISYDLYFNGAVSIIASAFVGFVANKYFVFKGSK